MNYNEWNEYLDLNRKGNNRTPTEEKMYWDYLLQEKIECDCNSGGYDD